jgi:hypothetical protein
MLRDDHFLAILRRVQQLAEAVFRFEGPDFLHVSDSINLDAARLIEARRRRNAGLDTHHDSRFK